MCYGFAPAMKPVRRPFLSAVRATTHASSPRRLLFVVALIVVILTLGALGALP